MSDIPDWLVELAAQRNQDADEEEAEQDLMPEPEAFVDAEPDSLDPVEALRSQVDDTPAEEEPELTRRGFLGLGARPAAAGESAALAVAPAKQSAAAAPRRVAGLLPWQQLILAVLLFLDVVVIGLLFLVMLGRVAIP